jgi:hypothetical protein
MLLWESVLLVLITAKNARAIIVKDVNKDTLLALMDYVLARALTGIMQAD